jgi:hypothetical protein
LNAPVARDDEIDTGEEKCLAVASSDFALKKKKKGVSTHSKLDKTERREKEKEKGIDVRRKS